MAHSILVIEDEKDLADLVVLHLQEGGYRTVTSANGIEGCTLALTEKPDLILLDLMLPGRNGIEVCRHLKEHEQTKSIPIIMVTAKGEEIDRVVGFEVGADDYIVKPFSVRELMLRVRAVLRRSGKDIGSTATGMIRAGSICIDPEGHRVTVDEAHVDLTTTEYKLLLKLCERIGRVHSRDRLLMEVWGYDYAGDTRTVDTHVTRLRSKLGTAGAMIVTVRGFGYKVEKP
ncbi:response regulator [Geobacter sp. DSM 9736]|uniref:response regulator n=1 Tax=Geobacter sp. DSM 9736 TaxID=1277350 RepID=UPI000B50DDE3|nr:response regulator [Geobacter sp. DSM 9736]SNB44873.1 two-component system, OmpR family, phosphate regulon response regulator PhoB [Geobacter sp. DSM 9736]